MGVLTRGEKRLAEHHLKKYKVYQNTVDNYYSTVDGGGNEERIGSVPNRPGNPTERQVIATLEPPTEIRDAQRWLRVHRMTRDRLAKEKREFMERVFYRDQSPVATMAGMHIEERAYYRWKDEVITMFAFCIVANGILDLGKTATVFPANSVL